MKALVIGGRGFIGSNLVPVLEKTGREVFVSSGDAETDSLLPMVSEIIHIAYSSTPKTSFENPVLDILENLPSTVSLFEKCRAYPIEKFIYVSSGGAVYGEQPGYEPVSEMIIPFPFSPYGITKLAIEKYALMYHKMCGLPIVILRPSTAYGIGQEPERGQGFINTALWNALHGKTTTIYGNTFKDYINVSDVVSAIISTIEKSKIGEIYNIGTEKGEQLTSIIDYIQFITGKNLQVNRLDKREFDVQRNVLDCKKIYYHTGWKSEIDIKVGIKNTWEWIKTL